MEQNIYDIFVNGLARGDVEVVESLVVVHPWETSLYVKCQNILLRQFVIHVQADVV